MCLLSFLFFSPRSPSGCQPIFSWRKHMGMAHSSHYTIFCLSSWHSLLNREHPTHMPTWFAVHILCAYSSLSRVQLFATPWTVACQAPPSMGFSRQEYWSGLPCPSPGGLPYPGIEPRSPTLQWTLYRLIHQGSSYILCINTYIHIWTSSYLWSSEIH